MGLEPGSIREEEVTTTTQQHLAFLMVHRGIQPPSVEYRPKL
jgi:hypothetical protein